jgi:hypothetical protein
MKLHTLLKRSKHFARNSRRIRPVSLGTGRRRKRKGGSVRRNTYTQLASATNPTSFFQRHKSKIGKTATAVALTALAVGAHKLGIPQQVVQQIARRVPAAAAVARIAGPVAVNARQFIMAPRVPVQQAAQRVVNRMGDAFLENVAEPAVRRYMVQHGPRLMNEVRHIARQEAPEILDNLGNLVLRHARSRIRDRSRNAIFGLSGIARAFFRRSINVGRPYEYGMN